jgi:hypothetical protein
MTGAEKLDPFEARDGTRQRRKGEDVINPAAIRDGAKPVPCGSQGGSLEQPQSIGSINVGSLTVS